MEKHGGEAANSTWSLTALTAALLCSVLWPTAPARSESENTGFGPTWKLLNPQEKQQFIAGYIMAWRDASQVTGIVLGYVRDNPQEAVRGLEKIRSLYDSAELNPKEVVQEIDAFFLKPENTTASLAQAMGEVRAVRK